MKTYLALVTGGSLGTLAFLNSLERGHDLWYALELDLVVFLIAYAITLAVLTTIAFFTQGSAYPAGGQLQAVARNGMALQQRIARNHGAVRVVVAAALIRVEGLKRSPEDEAKFAPHERAFLREAQTIVTHVNRMDAAPLVKQAAERFYQQARRIQ